MSGGTSPPIPKSPKQSKLGNIGKKLIDGLKQMEISADSWQAPGKPGFLTQRTDIAQ